MFCKRGLPWSWISELRVYLHLIQWTGQSNASVCHHHSTVFPAIGDKDRISQYLSNISWLGHLPLSRRGRLRVCLYQHWHDGQVVLLHPLPGRPLQISGDMRLVCSTKGHEVSVQDQVLCKGHSEVSTDGIHQFHLSTTVEVEVPATHGAGCQQLFSEGWIMDQYTPKGIILC